MIGIICAMQVEADGIIALAENTSSEVINGMSFISGTLNGRDIVVVVCGEGKVNAAICAATLINRYSPDLVVNSGVAGALSPLVSIGDIVIASKAVEHDMNITALGYKQGEVSLPDGKVMFFECDKDASSLLEKCARELDASALWRARWKARQSVTPATAARLRLPLFAQFRTTLTRTKALIL